MTLALVKELVKLGNTEEQAIRMIVKDFQEQNPNDDNWKEVFQQVLSLSVERENLILTFKKGSENKSIP